MTTSLRKTGTADLLVRRRLLQLVQQALAVGHVLLQAPPGYGKSVLLRHLTARRPDTFYFQLTPADLDIAVLRARLQPRLLTGNTLLLDDVHLLQEGTEVLEWLARQLQQGEVHWVIVGRQLPLTVPLTARVTHVTGEQLAFTLEESRAFLGAAGIAQPQLAAWHEQLAGWPIGIDLLARLPDPHMSLPALQEHLFPYLAQAVLDPLPTDLRRFLRITAVPLHFSDALATYLLATHQPSLAGEARRLRGELQQRNLFFYQDETPGSFRYHDLFRTFLLEGEAHAGAINESVITWFAEQGDLEMAIEHALGGGMQRRAVELLHALPDTFLDYDCRYLTYRRWVRALDSELLDDNPTLLRKLGASLHFVVGMESEAKAWLRRAEQRAEQTGNITERNWARVALGYISWREGEYAQAERLARDLLATPDSTEAQRQGAARILFLVLSLQARFSEARAVARQLLHAAEGRGDRELMLRHRQNLAAFTLVPLGKLEAAVAIMQETLRYFADAPSWQVLLLMHWCEVSLIRGDWSSLAAALREIDALQPELEAQENSYRFWHYHYRAMLAIARGHFENAQQELLESRETISEEFEYLHISAALCEAWLLRRRGDPEGAAEVARAALELPVYRPWNRARLALERDLARGMAAIAGGNVARFELHPETFNLIRWRARVELVRLRALLAVVCWYAGDPRWRRHLHAARFAARRYVHYDQLLLARDPDLNMHVWRIALIEGLWPEEAHAALVELAQVEPLLPLLGHEEAPVQSRAAAVLASIGDERAMPPLVEAIRRCRDRGTRRVLQAALDVLEQTSPPPLHVQLLGDFKLWRGGEPVPDEAWPRPVVRRLFQYFALHRGQHLQRDRILEELWPTTPPDRAENSFRTVYSNLRKVLEPYMRPQGPSRYVAAEEQSYLFDPASMVWVDVLAWEQGVRATLDHAHATDIPPLPDEFLQALEEYAPLLPTLPYEEWLLPIRQRLDSIYIEGCLYAAKALLQRGEAAAALPWAQRAVSAAPWLEEAYQALMRAYAGQGQRSQALRAYQDATAALRRELDVGPSPLTRWLYERLQRGEAI